MKTLILNGSPKQNGDTVALINEIIKYLNGETQVISSVFDQISPCIDCRYCRSNPGCAINDKMQEVYTYLEDSDNIVIASPIWFSELSGPLMNIASRIQTYFSANYFHNEFPIIKPKNSILILVGAEIGTENKAVTTAHTIFKHMNALPCVASIFSLNTNNVSASDDIKALDEIRRAAILLNNLYQEKN